MKIEMSAAKAAAGSGGEWEPRRPGRTANEGEASGEGEGEEEEEKMDRNTEGQKRREEKKEGGEKNSPRVR